MKAFVQVVGFGLLLLGILRFVQLLPPIADAIVLVFAGIVFAVWPTLGENSK